MFCQKCGNQLGESDSSCKACGASAYATNSAPSAIDSDIEKYKAIIGEKNQDYYLQQFERFDRDGKAGANWNWSAFFVTSYWLLYRKMWLIAVIYFLLPYILLTPIEFGVEQLISHSIELTEDYANILLATIFSALLLVMYVLPPIYANALYYRHCRKKIQQAEALYSDPQQIETELAKKGGTSKIVVYMIIFSAIVAVIGMLAAIALPAYQDYTARTRIAEGLVLANSASEAVTAYYTQHQTVPEDLATAGFTDALPTSVQSIELNNENGILIITMATPPIADQAFYLIPSLDSSNNLSWQCASDEIAQNQLPPLCRD